MVAFILFVSATVGTLIVLSSPSTQIVQKFEGKRPSEVKAEFDAYFKEAPGEDIFANVVKWGCILGVAVAFTYVVEPLAVMLAITNEYGNQAVAYAMLSIVIYAWFSILKSLFFSKKEKVSTTTVTTEEGVEVTGEVTSDPEIKLGSPLVRNTRRAIYALPTFYLWYLFAISINVLPQ